MPVQGGGDVVVLTLQAYRRTGSIMVKEVGLTAAPSDVAAAPSDGSGTLDTGSGCIGTTSVRREAPRCAVGEGGERQSHRCTRGREGVPPPAGEGATTTRP